MDCNDNTVLLSNNNNAEVEVLSVELNNNSEINVLDPVKHYVGDTESNRSDGSKTTAESREDRRKRLKEQTESERLRRYQEIVESQKQAQELRNKQQEERRKKISELKQREDERRHRVEQKRRELDAKEKEKTDNLLKRNREREERAATAHRQHSRMTTSMINTSPRHVSANRMNVSVHSNGTSSGSEKCMVKPSSSSAVHVRSSSSCDVGGGRQHVCSSAQAAGTANASSANSHHRMRKGVPPPGFFEVDGNLIPINTRHAGCFMPYRGNRSPHVKGVLAWGPPPLLQQQQPTKQGVSVAWWAELSSNNNTSVARQPRSSSAHAALQGRSTRTMERRSMRTNIGATVTTNINSKNERTVRRLKEKDIVDRLATPRSGSQPAKSRSTKVVPPNDQMMSISVTKEVTGSSRQIKQKKQATSKKGPVPAVIQSTPPEGISNESLAQTTNWPDSGLSTSFPDNGLPTILPDSGLPTIPANEEQESLRDGSVDELVEQPVVADGLKTLTRRNSGKNLKDTVDVSRTENSSTSGGPSPPSLTEEELYKQKLAEQRRLIKEKREEQLEEQRRLEKEAREKVALERKRMEEEARLASEEEERRQKELERELQAEQERQQLLEEEERKKREELERLEEEKRQEKARQEEAERMERKRRLEKIMSRVKKPDESMSQSVENIQTTNSILTDNSAISGLNYEEVVMDNSMVQDVLLTTDDSNKAQPTDDDNMPVEAWSGEAEENASVPECIPSNDRERDKPDVVELSLDVSLDVEQPQKDVSESTVAIADSPPLISDIALDMPPPSSSVSSSASPAQEPTTVIDQPQFKSRLLQSMMAGGRLGLSSGRSNSLTGSDLNLKRFAITNNSNENSNGQTTATDSVPCNRSFIDNKLGPVQTVSGIVPSIEVNNYSASCIRNNGNSNESDSRLSNGDGDHSSDNNSVVFDLEAISGISCSTHIDTNSSQTSLNQLLESS